MNNRLFLKALAEFFGTFTLVFAGCGAAAMSSVMPDVFGHLEVSIVFGLVILIMVYTMGHISGAHFNPAVTIAFSLTRKFPSREIIPYIAGQCGGAVLGAFLILQMPGSLEAAVTQPFNDSWLTLVLFELTGTMILMTVIMAVATDYRAEGTSSGMSIGMTILALSLLLGPVTGNSLNPARSLGPALVSGKLDFLWLYLIIPPLGASLGAWFYDTIRCQDNPEKEIKGCC